MADDLHSLMAGFLQAMTHAELSETPQRIAGMVVPNADGLSKRQRIGLAIENVTQDELARFALKFAAHRGDIALDEAGRKVLESDDPPLSHITRRDVARAFGDDLAGERSTVEMVERYFPLSSPLEDFLGSSGRSLRDQIAQHMDRNPGDWSVEYLFGEIGAVDCSIARFGALLEETVHPLSRSGEEQLQTVAALNKILARDGYELGSVDKGWYPEFDGSDGEEAEERQGGFVVARGDAAELLDLVEHALDPVPVPILPVVAGRRVPAVRLGRNDGQDALDEQAVPDIVTVISLVGDHGFGLAYIQIDQIGDGLEIRGFATGQREAERASLTVCAGVDLARKAAAASTKTLLASPPFAPAAWL